MGPDNVPSFFRNPERLAFSFVVLGQAIVSARIVYITPLQPDHEHRFDLARWHSYMFETIFVLSAFSDRRNILTWNESPSLRWLGIGIYLIGILLSVWANLTWVNHLRRNAEHAFDNPVLLFEGPFKLIRYPALLYLVFYCLGFAILFRSWIGLVLMIPLISGIINRITWKKNLRFNTSVRPRRHTSKRLIHIYIMGST
jgi:protein-S-isoprenylcysteine O-methyltransferase Ste14